MGQSIVQIKQMGDALRSSGYKSIDSAVAELIDNSIEANAKDIFVIMREHVDEKTGRKCIYELAILDNGNGMEVDKLECCLGIGFTTKSDRKGMGRFGVGLPQASLHVTPSVEVYSWQEEIQNDSLVYKVWLDINKVKTGEQEEIDAPERKELPEWIKKFLNYRTIKKTYDFTKSGTLVYWKECDNVKPKTMTSLSDRLEFALGRKFRHLINNGTHNIRLITIGHEDNAIDVMPNDPLFLMKPNRVLGNLNDPENISERSNINCSEPIFELYKNDSNPEGIVELKVPYEDKETKEIKDSVVTIRFSKVRAEFYDQTACPNGNPGNKPLGKYVKRLEGISVVRANREIDFGNFDFYDKTNSPHHRWWGCEICFEPVLDEVFGVANTKQQVELRDSRGDKDDEAEESIWDRLAEKIKPTIQNMMKENAVLRKGSRSESGDKPENTEPERIIGGVEERIGDTGGAAQEEKNKTTEEEREERARKMLIEQGVEDPTIDQIRAMLNKDMTISYANIGRNGPFIDTDFSLGNITVKINVAHIFYNEFVEKMNDENRLAFELFIGALAQAINKTNTRNADENDQLLQTWDYRLKQYLQQIKNN